MVKDQISFRFTTPDPAGKPPRTGPKRLPTITAARQEVMSHLDEGITCPCCDQFCKLYKRKLNSGMARILIWLVKVYDGKNWVNVPEQAPVFVRRSNEVSRLCLWGLARERPSEDPDQRNSGFYKPTRKGYQFVHRQISVPSHVHVYNNTIMGWSDKQIDIVACLGQKFSYRELMNS